MGFRNNADGITSTSTVTSLRKKVRSGSGYIDQNDLVFLQDIVESSASKDLPDSERGDLLQIISDYEQQQETRFNEHRKSRDREFLMFFHAFFQSEFGVTLNMEFEKDLDGYSEKMNKKFDAVDASIGELNDIFVK